MKCPFCECENLEGADLCESCEEDLSALDGMQPQSELERALMEDPISEVPPREPICVSPTVSVYDVAKKMNKHHTGCVLVTEQDKLVGIATERDILYKASGKIKEDLTKLPITEIMTSQPESLLEDDTVAYALNRMSVGGFRHIPILKEEKVIGFLSIRDILRYFVNHLQ